MNGKVLAGVLGVGILAAGGGILLGDLMGQGAGEGADGGGVGNSPKEFPVTPADTALKVVRAASGKEIRIVGEYNHEAAVAAGALGQVVVVETPPANAVCNAVFEADLKNGTADLGSLKDDFLDGPPVLVVPAANGCKPIWNVLLRGEACRRAAAHSAFAASTLRELAALPDPRKKCFLKQEGTCEFTARDGQKVQASCLVPWGDARAKPGAPAVFPHEWAGRVDLNVGGNETTEGLGTH